MEHRQDCDRARSNLIDHQIGQCGHGRLARIRQLSGAAEIGEIPQLGGGLDDGAIDALGGLRTVERDIVDDGFQIAGGGVGEDQPHLAGPAVLGGDAVEHVFGGLHAALAGGGLAFLDALDLPGIGLQILPQRLIDDVVASAIHGGGERVDFADRLLARADGDRLGGVI